jgi:hypothetical protein
MDFAIEKVAGAPPFILFANYPPGIYWFRRDLPDTAPPSLPNCLPSPDFLTGGGDITGA